MSTSTNPPASVQAAALADVRSTTALGADLANKDLPLADRFRVLFTLRNIGGEDGVAAIARGTFLRLIARLPMDGRKMECHFAAAGGGRLAETAKALEGVL